MNGFPVRLRARAAGIAYDWFHQYEKWSIRGAKNADPVC
jgi:hypothetical protein